MSAHIYLLVCLLACLSAFIHSFIHACTASHLLDQTNILTPKQNPPNGCSGLLAPGKLLRIIQHKIHEFVESKDNSLNSDVHLLIQPHLHPGFLLEVPKDQIDGLNHHFLDAGGLGGLGQVLPGNIPFSAASLMLRKNFKNEARGKKTPFISADLKTLHAHWRNGRYLRPRP